MNKGIYLFLEEWMKSYVLPSSNWHNQTDKGRLDDGTRDKL